MSLSVTTFPSGYISYPAITCGCGNSLFTRWITHLGQDHGPIRKAGVNESQGVIREVPWEWIEATDSQLLTDEATESQLNERRKALRGVDVWEELEE